MICIKQNDLCLLSLFLNKIANVEYGLFEFIISFYCNIEPKYTRYIIKYLHIYYRFNSYNSLVNTIKEINTILKIKTKLSHNLTETTILNGILKIVGSQSIINNIEINYKYMPIYFRSISDMIINDDFFIIDIKTNYNNKQIIIINPSYEYCWTKDYYVEESLRYSQVRLIDIQNTFKFRKKSMLKKNSRYHPKFNIIKNIEYSTIRFFGLSTYYYWNKIEINNKLEKKKYINSISFC